MFAAGDLGSAGTAAIAGLASVLVALVLAALSTALYRLVAHPLARVPGPRLAAFSNAWQAYYARNGRMYELGTTLHKKYGPVVRVGPNEVWFDSLEAFRAIYGEELPPPPPPFPPLPLSFLPRKGAALTH